jgi:hypothetical protein
MSRESGGSNQRTNHVYVMAASHSGSTLLTLLIASHPDAGTIGETSGLGLIRRINIDDYRCSCGVHIRECEFWRRVSQEMHSRGFTFDVADFGTNFRMPRHTLVNRVLRAEHRGRFWESVRDLALLLSPSWRSCRPNIERRNEAFADVVRDLYGVRLLVDSSKTPDRLKFLRVIPSLCMKVVYLVRDGRAVALTYMIQNDWPMETAAREWRHNIRACRKCLATLKRGEWMQVRYEDLCARPEEVLSTVFRLIGLDPGLERPNFRASGNHVVGNKMRLEATTEVHLDDQWKTVLTRGQLADFDRIAGDVNREYGYA